MDQAEATAVCMLFVHAIQEMEEEIADEHRCQDARRRRRMLCLRNRQMRSVQSRVYCEVSLTVPVLQRFCRGEDTVPDFRLSRAAIHTLMQVLQLERQHGWGPTLETLVFLFWLASGSAYRIVSRVFKMPLSTVHRVVHRMADEVVGVLPRFISLPNPQEVQVVGDGFGQLAHHPAFSKTAGAIDGCHIRIRCPGGPDGQDYINRKLFPSIVLQAVCDHQGRFLDIFVGYPGSVHDARILRNSPIYLRGNYPPPGFFLVGDGGYPCLQDPLALITPYKRPVRGMVEQRFNHHHSRARSIIERAFGMMKARFRCIFLEALEVHVQFVPKVVACCAVLHNICLGVGDRLQEPFEEAGEEEDGDVQQLPGEAAGGAALRQAVAAHVSALQQQPVDHDYCQT